MGADQLSDAHSKFQYCENRRLERRNGETNEEKGLVTPVVQLPKSGTNEHHLSIEPARRVWVR